MMSTVLALISGGARRRYCRRVLIIAGVFIAVVLWSCQPVVKGSAPAITTQPVAQKKIIGESVTFTVAATGDPGPAYQWRKDGVTIAGATSASCAIASVVLNDAGAYSVVVTNSQGSVTSNTAMLLVTTGCPHPQDTAPPVDEYDPKYRILSPNGGETFHVGQQCTLTVWSGLLGSGELNIVIGPYNLTPLDFFPGAWGTAFSSDSTVNTVVFTVPESLFVKYSYENISSVSDSCLFKITNYSKPQYDDYSDCYFRITKP